MGERPADPRGHAGGTVALAHNGNLTNSAELRDLVEAAAAATPTAVSWPAATPPTPRSSPRSSPTTPDRTLEAAALDVLPRLRGAFCFVFMDEHTLYAARDPQGIRPLVIGRLERGWVVASETAALDIVGASFVREVEPGELVMIDEDGLRSQRFADADPKGCVFEYVYLRPARHDDQRPGRPRGAGRDGAALARRAPRRGRPRHADARVGHAGRDRLRAGVRHPLRPGAGRRTPTSGAPSSRPRRRSASSASGSSSTPSRTSSAASASSSSTTRSCAATRSGPSCGCCARRAAEVHVRISSPPVRWPCFYGIDFATRAELIATGLGVEEVRNSIGADSLGYISEDGMVAATNQPRERLCTACFTGTYPVGTPEDSRLGKGCSSWSCRSPRRPRGG